MNQSWDLIVVGAGAAGLMCAGTAASLGLSVVLIDANSRPGRKLMITGKGRCNLTNNCTIDDFLSAVRRNPRFLYSAINALTPQDAMAFFEELGVPLKTERGSRVFPVSDRAIDVVDALVSYMKKSGVRFIHDPVLSIAREENGFSLYTAGGITHKGAMVVIATGGLSYPATGSRGDGYRFAESFGHKLLPQSPSLVPIITQEVWCKELSGLSLKNVTLSVIDTAKGTTVYNELGEMLFTHFGVSGPLVLSASSHMSGELSRYRIMIDLKPGLSNEQLDARLLRDFDAAKNKDFINSLGALLPKTLIPVIVRLSGISPEQKVNLITKTQRAGLLNLLKSLPVIPTAFRPVAEAIVTSGGVDTSQIDPRTMQSKLVPGLYFAGEVLDLDAYTGGFNLQIAFSTGYLAGISAARAQKGS